MIRLMNHNDIDNVMDIWITAAISAHRFMNQSFWLKQYRKVKQKLKDTPAYVICEEQRIVGFAVVDKQRLAALYIISGKQRNGYGSLLLRHIQDQCEELYAEVYVKNNKALQFFKKHGFVIASQEKNPDSHQVQNTIQWNK